MARFRTAVVGACVVLATLTAGGCSQVNSLIGDQTLACGEVPEDICVRLADDMVHDWETRNRATRSAMRVTVTPWDCPGGGPPAARCWHVEASRAHGARSVAIYYQRADGTLVDGRDDTPVGP